MEEYTIKLSEQEVNTVLGALGEMPFKVAMQVVPKIQMQCKEQSDKKEDNKE